MKVILGLIMLKLRKPRIPVLVFVKVFLVAGIAFGQTSAPSTEFAPVDDIVNQVLASTAVPSASIAIVESGRIAYVHAYGNARLEPPTPARREISYSIGSTSKQFTAAAILILAEQHKLSLDDPVSRFLPTLTRANEVTIRELLSHTSGYQEIGR